MSIELEIYSCSICGALYVWKDDAINCHKQEKCCGAVEFEGPYPAFACNSCGKLFYYSDKPNPGYLVLSERRKDCEEDAKACCADAPINRVAAALDTPPVDLGDREECPKCSTPLEEGIIGATCAGGSHREVNGVFCPNCDYTRESE